MSYTIHSNIPVPAIKRGAPKSEYPFADLGVGQMFSVALKDGEDAEKVSDRLRGAAGRWRKSSGNKLHKFVVAPTVLPNDPMGSTVVGVWRVEDAKAGDAEA